MANILIIDGHQNYDFAKGKLSKTLVKRMKQNLSVLHNLKTTDIEKGWKKKEEQEKFLWADSVIYQFPVFWFGVPAPLKQYIQDVFEDSIFFKSSDKGYGTGGLLTTKTYMFSSTWNAPLDSFGHDFWQSINTPDEALVAFHRTQAFVGMKKLPSFSCHDVIKNPDIEAYLAALDRHLNLIFNK